MNPWEWVMCLLDKKQRNRFSKQFTKDMDTEYRNGWNDAAVQIDKSKRYMAAKKGKKR